MFVVQGCFLKTLPPPLEKLDFLILVNSGAIIKTNLIRCVIEMGEGFIQSFAVDQFDPVLSDLLADWNTTTPVGLCMPLDFCDAVLVYKKSLDEMDTG